MKPTYMNYLCACVLLGLATSASAGAQAVATASRSISPSAFVMGTGVFTGLENNGSTSWKGGKNLGVTAGFDLGVYAMGRYVLGLEVRGRYPVNDGIIVRETNILGGLRIAREPGGSHLRPYVDALYGRGQLTYQNGGFVVGNLLYTQTAGGVFAGGAGVEYDVTQNFSAKVDGQIERWTTPVTLDGSSIHSTALSVGVAYRFGAGAGPR